MHKKHLELLLIYLKTFCIIYGLNRVYGRYASCFSDSDRRDVEYEEREILIVDF